MSEGLRQRHPVTDLQSRHVGRFALTAKIGTALLLAFGSAGCDQKAPPPVRPAPVVPDVKSSTPEEAATSVLLLLQAELRAVARRDQAAAETCRQRCATLIAAKAISRELKTYAPILGENPLMGLVENWSGALAAYADNFDLERMSVPEFSESDKTVAVFVPATGTAGRADLRMECVRDGANWLVGSIAFDGTRPIKIPVSSLSVSRPASAPATSAPAGPQAASHAAPRP